MSKKRREFTEEEIEDIVARDTEFPAITADDLRRAVAVTASGRVKEPVSIRLDKEILEYYRALGPGYQTRINNDLLALVREKCHGRRRSAYRADPTQLRRTRQARGTWNGTIPRPHPAATAA